MKDAYAGLDEGFRERLRMFERKLAAAGIRARMICGLRSMEEQARLYAIGRRGKKGERIVTRAKPGYSYHNFGLAADYAAGGFSAQQREQFGQIAESLGLTWGGRWQIGDFGHVEWRAKALAELRSGAEAGTVRIVFDGKTIAEGHLADSKVCAPVRPVAEALGASVEDRSKKHREVVLRRQ